MSAPITVTAANQPTETSVADRRTRLAFRLGLVALIVGWVPLLGWLAAVPLMLAGVGIAIVVQWTSGPTAQTRRALLINAAAGVVVFLSYWGLLSLAGG